MYIPSRLSPQVHIKTCDTPTATKEAPPKKVRGTSLPVEYDFEKFIQNVERPDASWHTHTPAAEWAGIFFAQGTYDIDWADYGLRGSLCWEYLATLPINSVVVPENELTGHLPLENLPSKLTRFHVHCNALSGPVELRFLPCGLRVLRLDYNQFSGEVHFDALPASLQELGLQWNTALVGELDHNMLSERHHVLSLRLNQTGIKEN